MAMGKVPGEMIQTCISISKLCFEGVQGSNGGSHAGVGCLQLLPGTLLSLTSTSRS